MSPSHPFCIVAADFIKTGGMDRANHALAMDLIARGHEVHLVSHRVSEDLLAMPNVIFHRVPRPLNAQLLGGPLLDRAGRRVAKKILKRSGRVIVNGGNCLVGDVNWVHYLHAAHAPQVGGSIVSRVRWWFQHRMYLREERRALQRAKLVITNSNLTRTGVLNTLGLDPDKVRTVHLGLDTDTFRPATVQEKQDARRSAGWRVDQPVVAFIGALGNRRKGFDTLFDAWIRLHEAGNWDARLIVIGSGAELSTWQDQVTRRGMKDVDFLGHRSDVPDLLRRCDALVAPTRYEAYGLGIAEAVCTGLTTIVSRDAGVAELCPTDAGERLLLDDPNDVNELVNRLRAWQADPEGYRSAANQWARALRLRTWSVMAEQIVQVIQQTAPAPVGAQVGTHRSPAGVSAIPDGRGGAESVSSAAPVS